MPHTIMTGQDQQDYMTQLRHRVLGMVSSESKPSYMCPRGFYFASDKHLDFHDDIHRRMPTSIGASRKKIVQWICRLVAVYNAGGEIVHITMSYFDRFISKTLEHSNKANKASIIQLVAFGSLSLALKINQPDLLPKLMKDISLLSAGKYKCQHVERTEVLILRTLQWAVNPATSHCIVRHLTGLATASMSKCPMNCSNSLSEWNSFIELAYLTCDMAVSELTLVGVRHTSISLAALYNAIDECLSDGFIKQHAVETIRRVASDCHLECDVKELCARIRVLFNPDSRIEHLQLQELAAQMQQQRDESHHIDTAREHSTSPSSVDQFEG